MRKKIIFGVLIGVLVLAPSTLTIKEKENYRTVKAETKDISSKVDFTTVLYPRNCIKIELGDQEDIEEVFVQLGDSVSEGEVMVQLDDSDAQKQYDLAVSSYNQYVQSKREAEAAEAELQANINQLSERNTEAYNDMLADINSIEFPDVCTQIEDEFSDEYAEVGEYYSSFGEDYDVFSEELDDLGQNLDIPNLPEYPEYEEVFECSIDTETPEQELKTELKGYATSFYQTNQTLVDVLDNVAGSMGSASALQPAIDASALQIESAEEAIEARKIKAPFGGEVVYIRTDSYVSTDLSIGGSEDLTKLLSGAGASSGLDMASMSGMAGYDISGGGNSFEIDAVNFDPSGGNYIILADRSWFTIYPKLSEKDIIKVESGMPVRLTVKSTGAQIESIIKNVYPIPQTESMEEPVYFVEIDVAGVPEEVPIGATISGEIIIQEKRGVMTLPAESVIFDSSGGAYVNTLSDEGSRKETVVETGIQDQLDIEIVSGITKEQEVVVEVLDPKTVLGFRDWIKK